MTAAISSRGPTSTRPPSRPRTGTSFGTGTTTAAARSSRTICCNLDLSAFNPKAPPPQTDAFFEIVNASRSPEDAELADALDADQAGPPPSRSQTSIAASTQADFIDYLKDRKNSRNIPHRFEACGYTPVRNPDADDGLWRINGRRQAIYARNNLASVTASPRRE